MPNLLIMAMFLGFGSGEIPAAVGRGTQNAAQAVVRLHFTFKRDDRAIPGRDKPMQEKLVDLYNDQRMALQWMGVRIAPDGTVVCADPYLPLWRVDTVEGEYETGERVELVIDSLFLDYSALLFKPKDPPPAPLPYVRFAKPTFKLGDRFFRLQLILVSNDWHVQIVPELVDMLPLGSASPYRALFGLTTDMNRPFGGCLLLNGRGRALGFQVEYDLWDGPDGLTTYHPDVLRNGQRLSWHEWQQSCERIDLQVQEHVRKVQILLRNVKDEEDEPRTWRPPGTGDDRAISTFGIALPGGRFLVLADADRETVKQITRITVEDNQTETEVPFIGLFAEWGALIVGGAESVSPLPMLDDAGPVRGRLFVVHSVEERFGRLYQETEYNRFFNYRIGYRNEETMYPSREIVQPALLFDIEGTLIGFHLTRKCLERPEERRSWPQIVALKDIKQDLLSPDAAFDPLARPLPREEERRAVWLGVEFQGVNRPLMEMLGLLQPTREGKVGLLVSHVYRDSPAERLGIKPSDVLLRLEEGGRAKPIEFPSVSPWAQAGFYLGRSAVGETPPPYRIWRPRRNYLTHVLTRIGAGRRITLTWLADGQEQQASLVLEESPHDFDTTERFKEPFLGLTVRDLTYEVREVLRLQPEMPGLVISAVEPGGKAAVRQLRPYELLTHVDGLPLRTIQQLETTVTTARDKGRTSMVFHIWTFGETRVVTIDLTEEEQEEAPAASVPSPAPSGG